MKMEWQIHSRGIGIACMALTVHFLTAHGAHAETVRWSAAADGKWNVAANWTNSVGANVTPTSDDTATISCPVDYVVEVDGEGNSAKLLNLGVGNAYESGKLKMTSGTLAIGASGISMGEKNPSSGTIIHDGGTITSRGSIFFGKWTGSRRGYYYMNGGSLEVLSTRSICVGRSGSGFFYQTGGAVSAGYLYLMYSWPGVGNPDGLYEISGGTLALAANLVNGNGNTSVNGRPCFRILGSAATISVGGNYAQCDVAVLEAFIDNGGTSPIELTGETGSAELGGSLKLGVLGGLAVTASSHFDLIEASSITNDFALKPDATLWAAAVTNDIDGTRDAYRVSLAPSAWKGSIVASCSQVGEASFAAATKGHLTLTSVTPGKPLPIRLQVVAGETKTVQELIDYFNDNGLTATTSDKHGYDIELTFTPTAATSHLVWDLASFDEAAAIAAVAAGTPPDSILITIR